MAFADIEQTSLDISAETCYSGLPVSSIVFDGYLKVYERGKDEDSSDDENSPAIIPLNIKEGDIFYVENCNKKQTFTKPPSRFNQSSLIKELDNLGIGRPSTYASIVSTILDREYVGMENKAFRPTELGIEVNEVLVKHFDSIFNVSFTAQMEEELDIVASGEKRYQEVMIDFYGPFDTTLKTAEKEHNENSEMKCPVCGSPLVIRVSRRGRFLGCSNYPECTHTQPYQRLISQ